MSSAQDELTLRQALERALAQNPALAESRERVAVAEGLKLQAGLAPNPRLFLQSENTRWWSTPPSFVYGRDTDNFVYLSQVFETAGKRALRSELGGAVVRRAEQESEFASRAIALRVGLAYWAAVGAARSRDLLAVDLQNFDRIVEYHRIRVREGAIAEADLIRVELERDRISLAAESASRDARQTLLTLFREMGEENPAPAARLTEALAGEPAPPPAVEPLERAEVRIARAALEQSRVNIRLQQANARPDPEVLFGYKRSAGFDTLIAGVQINLPFRNRNQGAIAAAAAETRASQAALSGREREVRSQLTAAREAFESVKRQVERLREARGRAAETSRIAQEAYREGGTDLLRLLDAERLRIETEVQYTRSLAEWQQSAVQLRYAAGGSIP